ncbi:hypothetical protein BKA66DRAFT_266394 [Pyrenochaeta sp. MPI-SDFR-AT-0127]|nr:hypothetical protein BKA66DRAFT_266394 [Pyrenochaeta sp. MPI-SDFR-AT-0127]
MFVLEFHLPYLTLRETVLSGGNPNMNIDQLAKVWADVSYLQLECTQCEEHKGSCEHLIREAHVSIVICGKDEFKWVGWAFVNTPSDPTSEGDKEEGEDEAEGDEKYEEGEDDDEGPNEDYFATDGEGELVVDANETTWDPRRYWLQIIDSRVKLALKEWEWLVKNVENGVNAWKEVHSLELAKAPDDRDQYNTEELFDWTIKTMQILRKLRAHAKTTHQTWARFAAPNGDSRFFLDLQDPQSKRALTSLKGSFQQLSDLRQTLLRLDESCKESKDMLSMFLERENNRMTAKNQELTRHIHELTEKSNLISYDIQVLSRKSTKATIASQKAADDTSRSTRINVLVRNDFYLVSHARFKIHTNSSRSFALQRLSFLSCSTLALIVTSSHSAGPPQPSSSRSLYRLLHSPF